MRTHLLIAALATQRVRPPFNRGIGDPPPESVVMQAEETREAEYPSEEPEEDL